MSQEKIMPLKPATNELEFSGERFVPGAAVEISYHHWLRYFFALQLAQDKRVLDVASGEGYGSAYLASVAKKVDGFDLSAEAVAHAREVYGDTPRVSFTCTDFVGFFRDAVPESYDLVTAFEIIEHVDERLQLALLEGISRVLAPDGVALISSPDKQLYSDVRLSKNPFHVREMYRDEFAILLGRVFPAVRMFEQLTYTGSALFESGATRAELCEMAWTDLIRLKGRCQAGVRGAGEYLIAAVAKKELGSMIESVVMLDRARQLIGEEVYSKKLEVEERKRNEEEAQTEVQKLRAEIQDVKAQLAAIRAAWLDPDEAARRDAIHQSVIDRLLGIAVRNAGELADAQRTCVERDMLRVEAQQLREELSRERVQHAALRATMSVQLMQRAKPVWDRVPFVRDVVKSIVKRAL